MHIATAKFGNLEVDSKDLITFSCGGPLGFEHLIRFFIIDLRNNTHILWLQSAEDPEISFPLLSPSLFKLDYNPQIPLRDQEKLNIKSSGEYSIYNIIDLKSLEDATVNLQAPIVFNKVHGIAKQVVLQNSKLEIKFPVYKYLKTLTRSQKNLKRPLRKNYEPRL